MTYVLGLDIGKHRDYTALTVVEPSAQTINVVHLHRYALGTAYTTIADDLALTLSKSPLVDAAILGVDATGLGGPFLDLLSERTPQTPIVGITITGQRSVKWRSRTDVLVPKGILARTMATLVEQHRLRIASGLALAPLLMTEMSRFRAMIDRNGRIRYAADTSVDTNDDLVLSAMYACWLAVTLRL